MVNSASYYANDYAVNHSVILTRTFQEFPEIHMLKIQHLKFINLYNKLPIFIQNSMKNSRYSYVRNADDRKDSGNIHLKNVFTLKRRVVYYKVVTSLNFLYVGDL